MKAPIKRLLIMTLAVGMILATLPLSIVQAAESDFVIVDGVLTDYIGPGGEVVIPDGVTAIADDVFMFNESVTSVSIPSSVKEIGQRSFGGCVNLETVSIEYGLEIISENAFAGCTSLTTINLPESLLSISGSSFGFCSSLTSMIFPGSLQEIPDDFFHGCTSMRDITVSEGTTSLGAYVFNQYDMPDLQNVFLPASIQTIGSHPFGNDPVGVTITCYQDSYVANYDFGSTITKDLILVNGISLYSMPEKTTYMLDYEGVEWAGCQINVYYDDGFIYVIPVRSYDQDFTFEYSNPFETIGIETISLTYFGYTVSFNVMVTEFDIRDGVLVWYHGNDKDIVIPDGVNRIADYVFKDKDFIEGITFPESLKTIGVSTFEDCDNLAEVTFNYDMDMIDNSAFRSCDALESININGNIDLIGSGAFSNCSNLKTISGSGSINDLYGHTFEYCYDLVNFDIPVTGVIGINAFSGCSTLETIDLSSCSSIGYQAFLDCIKLKTILLPDISEDFIIADGAFYGCGQLKIINIPIGTKSIEQNVFHGCIALEQIYLPETIDYIQFQAFWDVSSNCKYYCETYSYAADFLLSYGLGARTYTSSNHLSAHASSLTNNVYLSWTTAIGATKYRIYLYDSMDGTYTRICDSTSNYETINIADGITINNGTEYTFLVRAYDGVNWSEYSISDHVSATPILPPEATIKLKGDTVQLNWKTVEGASYYKIDLFVQTSEYFYNPVSTENTSDLNYIITGLEQGEIYWIKLYACNDSGQSFSVSFYPQPITAPKPSAYAYTESIKLSWDECSGATYYKVYLYDGSYHTVVKTTGTSCTVSGLTNGVEYTYLVRAYNEYGGSAYGVEDQVSATPIAKPVVKTSIDDSQATLSWTTAPGATVYKVYSYDGKYHAIASTTDTSYTIEGLTNGQTYKYLVRAYNDNGGSSYSTKDLVIVKPMITPSASIYAYTTTAKLKWDTCTGATIYKIYSYDGSYHYVASTTSTYYTLSGLTSGVEYNYLVRAYNEYGGSAYGVEDQVSATPIAKPVVKTSIDDSQATLSWTTAAGATYYKVYSYDGKYHAIASTTDTSYTIEGLTNGQTYKYLVRAYNDNGGSSYSTDDLVVVTP